MKTYLYMLLAILYLVLFYDYFYTKIDVLHLFNSKQMNEILEGTLLLLFTIYWILFLVKLNQKSLSFKNVIPLLIVTGLLTVLCTSVILLTNSDEKVVKQRFALRSRLAWTRNTYIAKKSYRSALTSNARQNVEYQSAFEQEVA